MTISFIISIGFINKESYSFRKKKQVGLYCHFCFCGVAFRPMSILNSRNNVLTLTIQKMIQGHMYMCRPLLT